jgi:hypothetical protein
MTLRGLTLNIDCSNSSNIERDKTHPPTKQRTVGLIATAHTNLNAESRHHPTGGEVNPQHIRYQCITFAGGKDELYASSAVFMC